MTAKPEPMTDLELLAQWMMQNSYATGHGDNITDLLGELDWQHKQRLDSLHSAQGWRPIEDAPRDGTRLILLCPWMGDNQITVGAFKTQKFGRKRMAWYVAGYRFVGANTAAEGFSICGEPTHYMPLPSPPKPGVVYLTAHEKETTPEADRPTDEIEVTPSMLEAGTDYLETWAVRLLEAPPEQVAEVAAGLFRAMSLSRPPLASKTPETEKCSE